MLAPPIMVQVFEMANVSFSRNREANDGRLGAGCRVEHEDVLGRCGPLHTAEGDGCRREEQPGEVGRVEQQ